MTGCKLRLYLPLTSLVVIAACGGGGSASPPSPPPPPPPVNPAAPLALTLDNGEAAVVSVFRGAERALQYAHSAGSIAAKMVEASTGSLAENCPVGGSYSATLLDNGDGIFSAGDVLDYTYAACRGGPNIASATFDAELTIQVIEVNGAGEFQLLGDFRATNLQNVAMEVAYTLTHRGESIVARSNDAGDRLVFNSEAYVDFEFRFDNDGFGDLDEYAFTMAASVESPSAGGAFACRTTVAFHALPDRTPATGMLVCTGSGPAVVRQVTDPALTDVIDWSANGSAPFTVIGAFPWGTAVQGYLYGSFAMQPLLFDFSLPELPTAVIPVETKMIAVNPASTLIYGIASANAASNRSAIVAIDPDTGTVVDSITYANEPSGIGLATDDSLLYVGFIDENTVRKIDLTTFTEIASIDLGVDTGISNDGPLYARDISVSPDNPDDFAVSLFVAQFGDFEFKETALYRGTTKETRVVRNDTPNLLQFSSRGDVLYGGNTLSTATEVFVIDVVADGLQVRDALQQFSSYDHEFAVENDIVYAIDGPAFVPETRTVLGEYTNRFDFTRFRSVVRPDGDRNQVYYYENAFETFQQDTFLPLSAYSINDAAPAHSLSHIRGDRLALATTANIHIIDKDDIVDFNPVPCVPDILIDSINDRSFPTLQCYFHGVVYSAARDRIYALMQSLNGIGGNSIAEINPETLAIERRLLVGSEPKRIAISDDGSVIYAGVEGSADLVRVDVDSFSVIDRTSMRVDLFDGPLRPGDIEFLPGSNEDIAMSLRARQYTVEHRGIFVYRNGVEAPLNTDVPGAPDAREIEFGDSADRLYALNTETTGYEFSIASVDSSGVFGLTPLLEAGHFTAQFKYDSGDLYISTGEVISTDQLAQMTPFPNLLYGARNRLVEPDAAADKIYFYYRDRLQGPDLTMERYSIANRAREGILDLPRYNFGFGTELELVRIDADRVILVTEDRMLSIEDSQFSPD